MTVEAPEREAATPKCRRTCSSRSSPPSRREKEPDSGHRRCTVFVRQIERIHRRFESGKQRFHLRIFLPRVEAPAVAAGPLRPNRLPPGAVRQVSAGRGSGERPRGSGGDPEEFGIRRSGSGWRREALRLSERYDKAIHLMLTDVIMPGMNGCALADQLQPDRPSMRVIYMSGYADRDVTGEVKDAGSMFLQKPFTPTVLSEKLREALSCPRPRILVVDDEKSIRQFFCAVLAQAGYEVTEAANGRQAVGAIRGEKIDLVVTDLVMPGQEGMETIQALRREFPHLKIVAVPAPSAASSSTSPTSWARMRRCKSRLRRRN